VCLVLIALGVWFLLWRKGSKQKYAPASVVEPDSGAQEKYGNEVPVKLSQLDAEHGLSEMETCGSFTQLPGEHGVSELA